VFGTPVWALQWFGRELGGAEAQRWVQILQALLTGWVVYVAAAGMLFEGLVRLRRGRVSGDVLVAMTAVGMYVVSLLGTIALLFRGDAASGDVSRIPPLFHWVVLVLACWSAVQWWRKKNGRHGAGHS
jgi:cation transport ATPase